jgi:hypothetical protein
VLVFVVGIMSDLLTVFSIIVISLVTISVVIHLLPLIVLAALVLLALWRETAHEALSSVSPTLVPLC